VKLRLRKTLPNSTYETLLMHTRLEWIGLHRDRLPNLTHQIVIVTLLELASEVEDAYAKILGSS
jgi:phosphoenolpyruvate carboxylase